MSGRYNGAYMRAFTILPALVIQSASLSKDALRRLTWIDWYVSHGKNAEATCRHFGLSKSVFYRWLNRFNPHNLRSLEFDSTTRRPHQLRQMTTPQVMIDQVVAIRRVDPEKSKYEIQAELRDAGVTLGYNTIQKIINRHPDTKHIHHKQKIAYHRKLAIARIRAARELREKHPGSLVQIDTKHLYIFGQKFYVFVAVDCKTRSGFVWAYRTITSASAADFLHRVIAAFPFTVVAINTDNGSEYLKYFHQACKLLGIIHYFTYPRTPQMNGRAERLIQTFIYEFFHYQDAIPELADLNLKCAAFTTKYNHHRYHQALGYQTPAQYVTKLLTMKGN